jgi:Zn-dependent metalloprotease
VLDGQTTLMLGQADLIAMSHTHENPMDRVREPARCIIPPHMLKSMYSNGSVAQRQAALASIIGSARFRASRQVGAVLTQAAAPIGKSRRVFTANGGSVLPGTLVLEEGASPSADPAVNEAYQGAGSTYDLYFDIYQRVSLDDRGLRLDSTVHYQRQYDNAFWDGKQMVYGDVDGQLFNRFTLAIDVIGHELTHGVTQYTSNLNYSNQSGALNEAFSDVFGSLVKQRVRGQTAAQADWLIGEGLFTANVKGTALRSMKDPGTAYDDPVLGRDPQPGHMRDYVQTYDDNGGVHINSGIPNHAFFLTAVAMGGFAWEKAGRIWYVAARDKFSSNTDFQAAADLTHQVAGEIYGAASAEQQAVEYGWQGVGIVIGAPSQTQPPPPQPAGCTTMATSLLRSLFAGKPRGDGVAGAGAP